MLVFLDTWRLLVLQVNFRSPWQCCRPTHKSIATGDQHQVIWYVCTSIKICAAVKMHIDWLYQTFVAFSKVTSGLACHCQAKCQHEYPVRMCPSLAQSHCRLQLWVLHVTYRYNTTVHYFKNPFWSIPPPPKKKKAELIRATETLPAGAANLSSSFLFQ